MIHAISADPGSASPCHCARGVDAAGRPFTIFSTWPWSLREPVRVYLEGQYASHHRRIHIKAFGTLRFYAGLVGGAYMMQGCEVFVLAPSAWRDEVLPGSGLVPKIVLHNRAQRAGFFDGIEFPATGAADAKDALLINVAGERMRARNALPKPQTWNNEHARAQDPKPKPKRSRSAPRARTGTHPRTPKDPRDF